MWSVISCRIVTCISRVETSRGLDILLENYKIQKNERIKKRVVIGEFSVHQILLFLFSNIHIELSILLYPSKDKINSWLDHLKVFPGFSHQRLLHVAGGLILKDTNTN